MSYCALQSGSRASGKDRHLYSLLLESKLDSGGARSASTAFGLSADALPSIPEHYASIATSTTGGRPNLAVLRVGCLRASSVGSGDPPGGLGLLGQPFVPHLTARRRVVPSIRRRAKEVFPLTAIRVPAHVSLFHLLPGEQGTNTCRPSLP